MSDQLARAAREFLWETQRVNTVLEVFALERYRRELYQEGFDPTFGKRMTFAGFRHAFPAFPICLSCDPIGGLSESGFLDFSRSLERGPLYTRYESAFRTLRSEAATRPICLVVKAKIHGGLLVHNLRRPIDPRAPHLTVTSAGSQFELLVAEPFRTAIKVISASGWTPRWDAGKRLRCLMESPPTVSRPAPADLVRWLPLPAVTVLQWLVSELSDPTWFVSRVAEEAVGVVATDTQISEATGLSTHQVRRSLPALENARMIERYHQGGERILLVPDDVQVRFVQRVGPEAVHRLPEGE